MSSRANQHDLELARQQLIGFQHAASGHSIESLVEGMGLTAKEWNALRGEVSLSEANKMAVDRHFE